MRANKSKPLFFVTIAVIIIGAGIFIIHSRNQYGNVTLALQLPDTEQVVAELNGDRLTITGQQATYKLHSGEKKLHITKPGYKQFSKDFSLQTGQTLVITVNMQPNKLVSPSEATSQLKQSFLGSLPADFSVRQADYFYDTTWVVAEVVIGDSNTALLVGEREKNGDTWEIILGPGTLFTNANIQDLPSAVSARMYELNYVFSEEAP